MMNDTNDWKVVDRLNPNEAIARDLQYPEAVELAQDLNSTAILTKADGLLVGRYLAALDCEKIFVRVLIETAPDGTQFDWRGDHYVIGEE